MGEMTGALLYGRQSMGNDRSIAEQLDSGRSRAGAEGWDILGEYSDRISASRYATKARDDWPKLLADLKRPDVRVLWLWETSGATGACHRGLPCWRRAAIRPCGFTSRRMAGGTT